MNDKTEWVMVPRELTVGMAIAADKAWRTGDDGYKVPAVYSAMIAAAPTPPAQEPIPMVLHCQKCGTQHIDAPEESAGWANPPHRSHLCHACGHIWRPADVPTTGVAAIQTRGKNDSPPAQAAQPVDLWTTPDEDLNALLTLTGAQLGEADVALAGLDALERVISKLAPQESQPVAWIRFCSNGAIEGPLLDSQIEDVRRKSGAWTPLIAAPIPAQQEPKK